MQEELQDASWREGKADMTAELAWRMFANKLRRLVASHVLVRRRRTNRHPKVDEHGNIRVIIRRKKRVWKTVTMAYSQKKECGEETEEHDKKLEE